MPESNLPEGGGIVLGVLLSVPLWALIAWAVL